MRKKLGEILIASGAVTQADLDLALSDQTAGEPARLGDLLVALGRITPVQLARALSQQHAIPFIQLPQVPPDVLLSVPVDFQQQHRVVPFRVTADAISLAMSDPSNADAVDALRKKLGKKITRYVAAGDEIDALHADLANGSVALPMVAPSVKPLVKSSRASPPPSEVDLFGSLDEAPKAGASSTSISNLGDDLFSGLDLPPVADVPPPPKVAPLPAKASKRDEEEEPEFFEAAPVAKPAPKPPKPVPAPPAPPPPGVPAVEEVSFELEEAAGEMVTVETETIDVSPSGLFGSPVADLGGADEEVSITEGPDEPAPPPPAESSGGFDVAISESSGDFGEPAKAPAAVDDFFSETRPVATSTPPPVPSPFTSDEEEAVSFEEVSEPTEDDDVQTTIFEEEPDTDSLFSEVAEAAAALPEPSPPVDDVDPLPSEGPSSSPSWLTAGPPPPRTPTPLPAAPPPPPHGTWTGKLDDLPPSRLAVATVRALVDKGVLTEDDILEALGKKSS